MILHQIQANAEEKDCEGILWPNGVIFQVGGKEML